MPRSYTKNILRTFKSTRSRFIAIFSIVALGVGFLAGLTATMPDITDSMEHYMDAANLYDLRVVSTLGLTQDDVAALKAVPGVADARPAYEADLLVQAGAADVMVARAHSLPTDAAGDPAGAEVIGGLQLQEGRWPAAANECVVEAPASDINRGFAVGDTLHITPDNENLDEKLAVTEYTIVGTVHNAYYFSYEREPASVGSGTVALVFYVPEEAFAYEAYTEIYLTATGAKDLPSLGADYEATVSALQTAVEDISGARCQARYDGLHTDAQQEIDDAWAEYNDAKQEADEELADAAQTLAEGRDALSDGEREIEDGQQEYNDGLAELAKNTQKLADGMDALQTAQDQLTEGQVQYEDGVRQLAGAEEQLDAGRRALEDGEAQYRQGQTAYDAALAQVEAGETQLAAGKAALDAAQTQYDDGCAALEAKRPALAAAQQQYDQLRQMNEGEAACNTGIAQMAQGFAAAGVPLTAAQLDASVASLAALPPEQLPQSQQEWIALLQGVLPQPSTPENAAQSGAAAFLPQMAQALQGLVTVRIQLNAGLQAMLDAAAASGAPMTEAEARALYSDASLAAIKTQLDEGNAQLAAAEVQLAGAKTQLDTGWAEYNTNAATLAAGRAQLEATAPQLAAAKAQVEGGWSEYNAKADEFYAAKRTLESSKATIDDGFATLTDKKVELADAQKQLADGRATLADAADELADARATIAEKKQELLDGEIEYEDAKAEAEEKLADAKTKIEDGEAELSDLEVPEWYVWDRDTNVSFHSFDTNMNKLSAIAKVFPIFFFLVAALVVSTTMTRMVEEERLQIGTMKALGYESRTIMKKYLWYALGAAMAGALFGLVVGFQMFPRVIWTAYQMMYYMPRLYVAWHWDYALAAGGLLVGCTLLITLLTCRATLKENPAELMRPRAPKAGKRILLERIGFIWRRMPFTYKVTCRNLLRYKRRFWMTVIGVAGCTALLVTGFGISDSLDSIITKQFGEVYRYDLLTAVTEEAATEEGPVYEYAATDPAFTASLAVSTQKVDQDTPAGAKVETYLMTPKDVAAFAQFADLHERISRTPTPLTETGVIVTEKLAKTLGVAAGDMVELQNSDGEKASFLVSGVCEHYVSNYVYLSPKVYEEGFGVAPTYNTIMSSLADTGDAACSAISEKLLSMDQVASLNFTKDSKDMILNMLKAIDAVVGLIIGCAAALAFVVLYNLTNINIAERVKEIATIKVLGFYEREVDAYVNRESVALSVIGAVFGLGLGIILHRFVILTVEVDAVMFGREIAPLSFVYAFLLTMLFSAMVNLVMRRKLNRISMVESMKAPE